MKMKMNPLKESLATKIWLSVQLMHFLFAVNFSELRPIQLGDPLVWYLGNYWKFVLFMCVLASPSFYSRFVETESVRLAAEKNEQSSSRSLLNGPANNLILDSNVWMNPSLDGFFQRLTRRLRQSEQKLTLFGPQFDEICNIKDRKPFASTKGRLARLALARIEAMQRGELLDVQPIDFETDKRAFADPKIVMLIDDFTTSGKDVHFVTDDRELRIRARQYASQNAGNLTVSESKNL